MKNIVGISNLEAEILLIVWGKGTATNREVYEAFIKKDIRDKKSGFIWSAYILPSWIRQLFLIHAGETLELHLLYSGVNPRVYTNEHLFGGTGLKFLYYPKRFSFVH